MVALPFALFAMLSCECCLRFHLPLMACGLTVFGGDLEFHLRVYDKDMTNNPEKLPKYGTYPDPGRERSRSRPVFLTFPCLFLHHLPIPPQFHDSEMLGGKRFHEVIDFLGKTVQ